MYVIIVAFWWVSVELSKPSDASHNQMVQYSTLNESSHSLISLSFSKLHLNLILQNACTVFDFDSHQFCPMHRI
jgi:hypothetical protein